MKTLSMAAIVLVAVLLGTGLLTSAYQPITESMVNPSDTTNTATPKTIDVTGTASVYAEPDQFKVSLGFETDGSTALEVQEKLAKNMDSIRNALYLLGIDKKDIETLNYNFYPVRSWRDGKGTITGYKGSHTISIKTNDLETLGKIIDAASNAGSNKMGYITFELSEKKRAELQMQALKDAAKNAKEKAENMASGLDIKVVGLQKVRENNYYYPIYRNYPTFEAAKVAAEPTAPTQIDSKSLRITASVYAEFLFE